MRRNSRTDEILGLVGRAMGTVVGAPQSGFRSLSSVLPAQPQGASPKVSKNDLTEKEAEEILRKLDQ